MSRHSRVRRRRAVALVLLAGIVAGAIIGIRSLVVSPAPTTPPASATAAHGVVSGVAATPDGNGYWQVTTSGAVLAFGDARDYGDMAGRTHTPIVAIASTSDGRGYWLASRSGQVFSFGDAPAVPPATKPLTQPVVALTPGPPGGFWLAGAHGAVVALGTARLLGSPALLVSRTSIVAIAATPDGRGYWVLAADGTVYPYGDAADLGDVPSTALPAPLVAMAPTTDGQGYWLIGSDGAVYNFGNAQSFGSTAGEHLSAAVSAFAPRPADNGYWLSDRAGHLYQFGAAGWFGSSRQNVVVTGDSLAWTLGDDFYTALPPSVTVTDDGILGCGIAQSPYVVSNGNQLPVVGPCDGTSSPQWEQMYQGFVGLSAPNVVLLLVGYWEVNDRPFRGRLVSIGNAAYDSYLVGQLNQAITILHSGGAHVELLTMPYVDQPNPGPLAPEGVVTPERTDEWNQLLRSEATKFGPAVSVVDLNAEVDPGGHYAPSIGGVAVRTADGLHFVWWSPPSDAPFTQDQATDFATFIGRWLWPRVLGTSPGTAADYEANGAGERLRLVAVVPNPLGPLEGGLWAF